MQDFSQRYSLLVDLLASVVERLGCLPTPEAIGVLKSIHYLLAKSKGHLRMRAGELKVVCYDLNFERCKVREMRF